MDNVLRAAFDDYKEESALSRHHEESTQSQTLSHN